MKPPRKVLISGISGYLGRSLCRELVHKDWCESIVGFDVRRPLDKHPKVTFVHKDITDRNLPRWMAEVAADAVIHLAFIVDPIHDEARMRQINVNGTKNVLAGVVGSKTQRLIVASSGSAYGAWPDNPPLLTEDHPLRANPGFRYAADKAEIERLCARFAEEHSEINLSTIRPCVVYGPGVNNYLSRLLAGLPIVVGLAGYEPPLQFVHEDDVVASILALLETGASGPFNIAPPDSVTMVEALETPGKRILRLPDFVLNAVAREAWRFKINLLGAPPQFLDYMRYPWVLDSTRIREVVGVEFRYSSHETLDIMLRAKGVI